jgi:hypothetical protein
MATRLPDGTAVVHPPGKRAVNPKGDGTVVRLPNVAAGGGTAKGSSLPKRQTGKTVSPRKAR